MEASRLIGFHMLEYSFLGGKKIIPNSPKSSKVFISYSHDSPEHKERVLQLSNRLRSEGIDCDIDQYEISPSIGWPRWMKKQIKEADFVLVICTDNYEKRFEGEEESEIGLGVKWEGAILTQELYDSEAKNNKFVPVVLSSDDSKYIPVVLRGVTHHNLDNEEAYNELYARLTGQKLVLKPNIGELRHISPRPFTPFGNAHDKESGSIKNKQKPKIGALRSVTSVNEVNFVDTNKSGGEFSGIYEENHEELQLVSFLDKEVCEVSPYLKLETKEYLACSIFSNLLNITKGTYYFYALPESFVTVEKLESVLKIFYDHFGTSDIFENSSFTINQTCFINQLNYSWVGFGPKNFVQALKEQSQRYSEAGILKPHHREVAGFLASRLNFIFYIALQPNVIKGNVEQTFDYMQVGFIFEEFPFNTGKFIDFFKEAGLEEPNSIEEGNLNIVQKDLSKNRCSLNKEGFVVYDFDREYWVSKVILKNPFYGIKKVDKYLSSHEKLVVNLIDYHPLDIQKDYFFRKLTVMQIPCSNFPFVVLILLGNW